MPQPHRKLQTDLAVEPVSEDGGELWSLTPRTSCVRMAQPGLSLGSYEIVGCIAQGGMATVWAARQCGARGFNRLVALKTVLAELSVPEFEAMFVQEARIASQIHHPNVCEIFELIEDGGLLALSMEWVDGDTLAEVLSSCDGEPLGYRMAAHIISEVACGVHAAHEAVDENGQPMHVVHRDVSPQNVLISKDGHVKVTDFGVAKALACRGEATEPGYVKGKLSFMSPEQARGLGLDRRTDIFSIGVLLYMATVGQHPFQREGESRDEQLARLLTGRLPPPSHIDPDYPPGLERIVLRALAPRPEWRFASAAELRRELQEWLVAMGPLVTEHDVAAMMHERVGTRIEERAQRIRRCLGLSSFPEVESTLVPSSVLSSPRPVSRTRKGLTLTAALVAISLTVALGLSILTSQRSTPGAHVAAPKAAGIHPPPSRAPHHTASAATSLTQAKPPEPNRPSQARDAQDKRTADARLTSPPEDEAGDKVRGTVRKRSPRRSASARTTRTKAQLPCRRWGI